MSDLRRAPADETATGRRRWCLWVDTGGTFTDCVGITPRGGLRRAKVLSSGSIRAVLREAQSAGALRIGAVEGLPNDFYRGAWLTFPGSDSDRLEIIRYCAVEGVLEYRPARSLTGTGLQIEIFTGMEAPLLAAHWVTGTPLAERLPELEMRLATTRGTNALLERKGAPTVLFITRGFADLLEIGNQQRPDLFALSVRKRKPLYAAVVEVEERLDAAGSIIEPLNLDSFSATAESLLAEGCRVAAVALLHSYRYPEHERRVARYLSRLGFEHVSISSQLSPLIKIVPRAETAVVNAYLSQSIGRYLETVDSRVEPGPLHVLTSAGGLVRAASFAPKDSLLSGPAGGVVGAATVARKSGFDRILAFDMGGTSTDVSRFDGDLDYRFETRVGDALLLSPSLAVETVAAGGGSICHFEDRQLKVGPESAGASPGPACYGRGGPLTLTDVNLLLGRLRAESFEIPIDPEAARIEMQRLLAAATEQRIGSGLDADRMLEGLLAIANERMAEAIRRISIRQGYRPSEYALVAFGGAGAQHACAVADLLSIETILVPEDAGLLSAVGLGGARIERIAERQVLRPLDEVEAELTDWMADLERQARLAVVAEGVPAASTRVGRQLVFLRLRGQESELELEFEPQVDLTARFLARYEDTYGYRPSSPAIEIESARVLVAAADSRPVAIGGSSTRARPVTTPSTQPALVGGGWVEVPVHVRSRLEPGDTTLGPALVFEDHAATFVDSGWKMAVDTSRCLVLTRELGTSVDGRERPPGGSE